MIRSLLIRATCLFLVAMVLLRPAVSAEQVETHERVGERVAPFYCVLVFTEPKTQPATDQANDKAAVKQSSGQWVFVPLMVATDLKAPNELQLYQYAERIEFGPTRPALHVMNPWTDDEDGSNAFKQIMSVHRAAGLIDSNQRRFWIYRGELPDFLLTDFDIFTESEQGKTDSHRYFPMPPKNVAFWRSADRQYATGSADGKWSIQCKDYHVLDKLANLNGPQLEYVEPKRQIDHKALRLRIPDPAVATRARHPGHDVVVYPHSSVQKPQRTGGDTSELKGLITSNVVFVPSSDTKPPIRLDVNNFSTSQQWSIAESIRLAFGSGDKISFVGVDGSAFQRLQDVSLRPVPTNGKNERFKSGNDWVVPLDTRFGEKYVGAKKRSDARMKWLKLNNWFQSQYFWREGYGPDLVKALDDQNSTNKMSDIMGKGPHISYGLPTWEFVKAEFTLSDKNCGSSNERDGSSPDSRQMLTAPFETVRFAKTNEQVKNIRYPVKISATVSTEEIKLVLVPPSIRQHKVVRNDTSEKPLSVDITKPFYVQTTELTVGQWNAYLQDTKRKELVDAAVLEEIGGIWRAAREGEELEKRVNAALDSQEKNTAVGGKTIGQLIEVKNGKLQEFEELWLSLRNACYPDDSEHQLAAYLLLYRRPDLPTWSECQSIADELRPWLRNRCFARLSQDFLKDKTNGVQADTIRSLEGLASFEKETERTFLVYCLRKMGWQTSNPDVVEPAIVYRDYRAFKEADEGTGLLNGIINAQNGVVPSYSADREPMVWVIKSNVDKYVKWLNERPAPGEWRLPTEYEWEVVARFGLNNNEALPDTWRLPKDWTGKQKSTWYRSRAWLDRYRPASQSEIADTLGDLYEDRSVFNPYHNAKAYNFYGNVHELTIESTGATEGTVSLPETPTTPTSGEGKVKGGAFCNRREYEFSPNADPDVTVPSSQVGFRLVYIP